MTEGSRAIRFPDGFVWGVASSAYQIEGSPLADGAGPSIQHRFAHTPGNTPDGSSGDVAADHYHRFREDVTLMRDELGVPAYELSIAWPRILPEGTGRVNERGLDFYDALVDALLEADIAPAAWLYVWDLPAALQDRGGWANRDSADWFAEYASIVFDRLGDRVTHWFTICEPQSVAHHGYITGDVAPCMRDLYAGLRATHHLLLGQGRAIEAFRASDAKGQIGNCHALADIRSVSEDEDDVAAAERTNAYVNALSLDAMLRGKYPQQIVEWFGDAWPSVADGDLATISVPMDFVGISFYIHSIVGAPVDGARGADAFRDKAIGSAGPLGDGLARLMDIRVAEPTRPTTGLEWEIVPDGLTRVLRWLCDRYGNPPVFISETGASFEDTVTDDGQVKDPYRIDWMRDHLLAAHRAIEEGVDLRGLFYWGFLDTYEFNLGNNTRFGLVYFDYETQQRIVKDSGYWFRDVIANNGFEVG
jgi:beta-glucosidase